MNWIFDFDGTIVDDIEAFIAVFNKNIRHNKNPLSPEEIQALRSMSSRKAVRHIGVKWWQLPRLILEGIPDFHALLPGLKPFKDLPKILKQLQARGDKLFIVTSNTKGSVDAFLEHHNMRQLFTEIDTGAGVFNKSGRIRKLITSQHLKRSETVYVGDETRDITAARRARVPVVSVTWGFNDRAILENRHPNYLIDSPKDLLTVS